MGCRSFSPGSPAALKSTLVDHTLFCIKRCKYGELALFQIARLSVVAGSHRQTPQEEDPQRKPKATLKHMLHKRTAGSSEQPCQALEKSWLSVLANENQEPPIKKKKKNWKTLQKDKHCSLEGISPEYQCASLTRKSWNLWVWRWTWATVTVKPLEANSSNHKLFVAVYCSMSTLVFTFIFYLFTYFSAFVFDSPWKSKFNLSVGRLYKIW